MGRPRETITSAIGKRISEEIGNPSFAIIGEKLGGIPQKTVGNWMRGKGHFDADAVGKLIRECGLDAQYILTGERSPQAAKPGADLTSATADCPNGKLCDTLPRFVAQLAVILEEAVSADPDVRRRAAATIRTASSMLEEVFRALPETRRDAVGS